MKKLLYILYVPLLLIEWMLDAIVKIFEIIRNSFETLTLAVKSNIDESTSAESTRTETSTNAR
jgi:hypothetical protein